MADPSLPIDPAPPSRVTVQRLDAPREPVGSYVGPSFLPPSPPVDRGLDFRRRMHALTPRVFVANGLLAMNVLVYVWMGLHGVKWLDPTTDSLLRFGADYGPNTVAQGQWWRMLTATFVHIGFLHLAMNMYVLWAVGPFVERLLGNVGFAVAYVVSGLAGSLASLWMHPMVVGAGASGAIFGLFGALAGFVVLRRDSIPQAALRGLVRSVLVFVGLNVMYGLAAQHIDMAAHLGGLLGGLVCGLMLSQPLTPAAVAGRRVRNAMTLVVGLGVVALLASRLPRDYLRHVFVEMMEVENRARPLVRLNEQGKLGDAAFAAAMSEKVLPPWRKIEGELLTTPIPRERVQEKAELQLYLAARQAEWDWDVRIASEKITDPWIFVKREIARAQADGLARQLRNGGSAGPRE